MLHIRSCQESTVRVDASQDVGNQEWHPHTSNYRVVKGDQNGGMLSWALSEALTADEVFQQVSF